MMFRLASDWLNLIRFILSRADTKMREDVTADTKMREDMTGCS